MLELFFFILGLVNSVFLIFIFLIRKNRLALLRRLPGHRGPGATELAIFNGEVRVEGPSSKPGPSRIGLPQTIAYTFLAV